MPLPMHVVELLEHAARHPDGAQPLFDAQLECTAALYQVHPERVEAARSHFTDATRAKAELIVSRAVADQPREVETAPVRKDADAVISAALAMPHGFSLLMKAPIERAAVLLDAHPFVVEEARVRMATSSELAVSLMTAAPGAPHFQRSEA